MTNKVILDDDNDDSGGDYDSDSVGDYDDDSVGDHDGDLVVMMTMLVDVSI